jgi:hypothetical protein
MRATDAPPVSPPVLPPAAKLRESHFGLVLAEGPRRASAHYSQYGVRS